MNPETRHLYEELQQAFLLFAKTFIMSEKPVDD